MAVTCVAAIALSVQPHFRTIVIENNTITVEIALKMYYNNKKDLEVIHHD